ncbi:MAG: hypothetical protein ACE5HE_03335 [Phycisphaerae bacterium]
MRRTPRYKRIALIALLSGGTLTQVGCDPFSLIFSALFYSQFQTLFSQFQQ